MPSDLRFAVVLVGSVVLGWPALGACLAGDLGFGAAAIRCAGAAALVWLAMTALGAIVRGYAGEGPGPDGAEDLTLEEVARRRSDDRSSSGGAPGDAGAPATTPETSDEAASNGSSLDEALPQETVAPGS